MTDLGPSKETLTEFYISHGMDPEQAEAAAQSSIDTMNRFIDLPVDGDGKKIFRYANTPQLRRIMRNARKRDYNRQLKSSTPIDPNGAHIVSQPLIHSHRNGEDCEPHIRCLWNIKLLGRKEPLEIHLDVPTDDYMGLPMTGEPKGQGDGQHRW